MSKVENTNLNPDALVLSGVPIDSGAPADGQSIVYEAATNKWVYQNGAADDKVSKSGDTMTGDLDMSGNLVKGLPIQYPPIYVGDEATSWTQTVGLVQDAALTLVQKEGDSMTGNLNMDGNTVTNVSDPVNAQDVASKNYVDTLFATLMN